MGCPKCQSDDISDSGICLACGYVISIDRETEEPEPADEIESTGSASANQSAEVLNYSGSAESGDSDSDQQAEPGEGKPAWRQELSQRLQAIKQKREATEQSGKAMARDIKPLVLPDRAQTQRPSITLTPRTLEVPLPVSRTTPRPKTPAPRQKTLQPVGLNLSGERRAPNEMESRNVQALIDNAVSGKVPPPPSTLTAAILPDLADEELPDEEGKLILLSRTLSGLVDWIIVMLCSGLCIIAADFFSGIIALDTVSYLIFSVLFLLTYFFYSLFFLAATNQTVGMMITDLRVVDVEGKRPSISQLLRRCFGHLASVLVLGLGLVWSLFDRESQCFHDRISDTRVLRI